ncbi:MAG: DUF4876 domain-containing protein [Phocaeicola sp.]
MKRMNKVYLLLATITLLWSSCSKENSDLYQTIPFSVELIYPVGSDVAAQSGIKVTATASSGVVYEKESDEQGAVLFDLPAGLYQLSATDKRVITGRSRIFTAVQSGVVISTTTTSPISLQLQESELSQIIIKELYNGGCQKEDGSGSYHFDKYLVLYNNSDEIAELQNLCIAMVLPYNSTVTNADYVNGNLYYEAEGWIPAGLGYFYFPNPTTLNPGEQIVVAANNANDNRQTYSNSVDLSDPNYYVMYAPEAYNNTSYHPAPSAQIPTNHYLPGFKYGTGNAWALSNTCPALFLFVPSDGETAESFNANADNISLYGGSSSQVRKKVPTEWIIDGLEVFRYGATNNAKRLTATVDAGYVNLTAGYGYTLYRNVDKEATEAIEENRGKLIYNYALGTVVDNGTTDPSGIDAEASILLGARIVYMDTNNSSNDFHQRAIASLKK